MLASIAVALSFALFEPVPAGASAAGPFDYDIDTIAPGVIGFFEQRINPVVSSNVVAVIGTESVLVFDAGHHPLQTRQIIRDLRSITPLPVRYLVVSHWHDDHWIGNAEFAKAFPAVQVIAHRFTARMLETRRDGIAGDACRRNFGESAEQLRALIARGTRPDGTPIPAASMERMQRFSEAFDAQLAQCDSIAYRGVDRAIDDSLTLDVGGRVVKLLHLGRGNTAGDVVGWLPESRTLMVGDLLVSPFPFATASYITEWAAVLRRVERMDPQRTVPGHGRTLDDLGYLRTIAELLESIARQARAAYRPGMTAEELRRSIDLSPFAQRIAGTDAFIRANFDGQMKGSAIERMWQELSGEWKPEGD